MDLTDRIDDAVGAEVEVTAKARKPRGKKTPDTENLSGKRLKVKFHKNSDAGGNSDAVYIGLNGVVYAYKYETEVEVPEEVLSVADHAVMDKFTSDRMGNIASEKIARFPYSVVR